MSVGCTLPAQTGTATCGTSWGPETMSLPWPYRQFGHLSRAEPACGGFFPLTNISVVWRGGFLLTARRAPRAAPPHSPGEGRPAAGGNSCGRSAGGRRGWRPAGRSSTPCTLPAKRPGTRRDAARRGDVLLQHRGCQRLVWGPGTSSASRAKGLLPADAQDEFILLLQAVPRDWIHHLWLGLAGWFAVGWLWQKPGTPEHWEEDRKEPKIEGEVWILSCTWPCCSLEDNGCVLGQNEDM